MISIGSPISAERFSVLIEKIKAKSWWQGSTIAGNTLPPNGDGHDEVEWWVITSQACNLYNANFEKVPVFELVAACQIEACHPMKIKGDNPRILHIEARSSEDKVIALELDIQKRRWLPRALLADLPAPTFSVRDAERGVEPDWLKNQWQDNLAGWLARSYTRVALPDEFNTALDDSRIKAVLEEKLTKYKDYLYGIYLSVEYDSEAKWNGSLGLMPPPYILGITLVTHEEADPEALKKQLVEQIFQQKIPDPTDPTDKSKHLTRASLAKRHNVRVIEAAIEAKSVADITLLELKSLVRYSLVDHLSDSTMASA